MKENVGKRERLARILAGSALIGFGVWKKNWVGALGGIPLATGLLKYCPVNEILGINIVRNKNLVPEAEPVSPAGKADTLKLKLKKSRKARK